MVHYSFLFLSLWSLPQIPSLIPLLCPAQPEEIFIKQSEIMFWARFTQQKPAYLRIYLSWTILDSPGLRKLLYLAFEYAVALDQPPAISTFWPCHICICPLQSFASLFISFVQESFHTSLTYHSCLYSSHCHSSILILVLIFHSTFNLWKPSPSFNSIFTSLHPKWWPHRCFELCLHWP